MDDKEKKELMEIVTVTMVLEKLIDDIKTQETRFLLLDLDNLNDEDKDLIKAYRKNLRTLYTKYSKSERALAGDIEKDFFKPSPTNEMEDKFQREKQSTFDQLLHLKEEFYKKLLFQFKNGNIELLKNLQKQLEKMLSYSYSNKKNISDVDIPEDKLDKVLKENDVVEKVEINLNLLDNNFLSDNKNINDKELPKMEEITSDIREQQIDEIFDDLNREDKKELDDFKLNDGNIDYDTQNHLNETINKIVSFEQAFKELNLNNVTLLTLAFIKEYQAALKRFKTEFTDVQREEAGAKSRSIVFGDTPLYFKLGNQSESDKKLEENYNIVINELKKDVEKFIHIDVNQYDEIDFEWLKRFQARLNLADTFFEAKEMEKHI